MSKPFFSMYIALIPNFLLFDCTQVQTLSFVYQLFKEDVLHKD